jgi:glycosyltransferase involved in cell wall biosynthesis
MRVGIDARCLRVQRKSGVEQYAANVIRHLCALPELSEVLLYVDGPTGIEWPPTVKERVVRARFGWLRLALPLAMRKDRVSLAHFPATIAPGMVPCPFLVTVYDLAFKRFPEAYSVKGLRMQEKALRSASRAARVIAVSQSTKRDLVQFSIAPEDGIDVVPGAPRDIFRQDPAVPRKSRDVLLFVGVLSRRKNVLRLVEAYCEARAMGVDLPLLLAGEEGELGAKLRAEVAHLGLENDVRILGFVEDHELAALYRRAVALVFPSLYEGFGLPVVEAMACGTPVITSDCSSLAEVGGDAAVLVNPLDVDAIAQAIVRVCGDEGLWHDLSEKGLETAGEYSWEQSARSTLEAYRSAASYTAAS